MNIVIVHEALAAGAREDEVDGQVQARLVQQTLDALGHRCRMLPCSLDLAALAQVLQGEQPDLVFNLVEALQRRNGLQHLVPAVVQALGVPCTGNSAEALLCTTHKVLTKRWLLRCGLPTPAWHTAHSLTTPSELPVSRYILKPLLEDASVGLDDDAVIEVTGAMELTERLQQRGAALGCEVFAEAFVEGREFNVSLLTHGGGDVEVLPLAEMLFDGYAVDKPRIVGYAAKWDSGSFEYAHTPRRFDLPASDGPLVSELQRLAQRCWELFELRGYARVDFRVDERGRPWILEVNANPCLSPDAGFMAAAQCAGLSFAEVVQRIVAAVPAPACRACG